MLLKDLKKLVLRAFPGLGGYQHLYYAKVQKVYEAAGKHSKATPYACCDVQLLAGDFAALPGLNTLTQIPLHRVSRHIFDPPRPGDLCLLAFPYWRMNQAVLLALMPEGQEVQQKSGVLRLEGADQIEIGSGEDFAVLANKLCDLLTGIMDAIELLGQAGNLGSPLANLATVQQNLANLKNNYDLIKSNVKLGKTTQK